MGAMMQRIGTEGIKGEGQKIAVLERKLRGQEDINGFCSVLRDSGAVFYEDLREFPEFVDLGHLKPEIAGNDWVSRDDLRGRWKWRYII